MKTYERLAANAKIRDHYETVWSAGDPWSFDKSQYEQHRFAQQISLLSDRRYNRVLEIGCGAGAFTRFLSPMTKDLVALDISTKAIERARLENRHLKNTAFVAANIMDFNVAEGQRWDLVVLSETIYCLGWLYPLFDVGWLLSQLRDSMSTGGRLLLANTFGQDRDYLLRPWLIKTYRDLVCHVGFALEREEVFEGVKDGTSFRVLMSLFEVPATEPATQSQH